MSFSADHRCRSTRQSEPCHPAGDATTPQAAGLDPQESLALIATIARQLRAGPDVPANVRLVLSSLQGALSLHCAYIWRLEGDTIHTVATVGPPSGSATSPNAPTPAHVIAAPLADDSPDRWRIECRRHESAPFEHHERQLIATVGTIVAGHLDRIPLLTQLWEAGEDALRALAAALASRDRYTGSHVEAVCVYAERLGQRLGLDRDALRVLHMGSILHDIGKIGVSDAVLQKPGPLTDHEAMQMRQHPVIGAQIVRQVQRLEAALPIVLYHHERWDGTGYPSGLAGEHIPIGARIVAVVDSFHAITSTRPYRPARSTEEALGELRLSAGTHFDPAIVAAFIALLSEADSSQQAAP